MGKETACGGFFRGRLMISHAGFLPPIQGVQRDNFKQFP